MARVSPSPRRPAAPPVSGNPDDLVRELGRLVGELINENRRLRREVERLAGQRKDMSESVERALVAIRTKATAALAAGKPAARRTARRPPPAKT